MSFSIAENTRAVLLPAFDGTVLSDQVKGFLDRGGISILLGESREEYVARKMSSKRREAETAETLLKVTADAKSRSGLLLSAVDQELGGICRLHDLVPQFPQAADIGKAEPGLIEDISRKVAEAAAAMGVNVFLAPVLDVLDGENTWLNGRTWSQNPATVASLSSAYIRGVQQGGVAATAKHFPGFRSTTGDPAIDPAAVCLTSLSALEEGHRPFQDAVTAGVEIVMVGPAPVTAIDPHKAALRSEKTVRTLKADLQFEGLVLADDLDSKATLRGDTVAEVALDALNAGCHFLLLADTNNQLDEVATAIQGAAETGKISATSLAASADRVRALARKYAAN
jgi:beta-N-acetylhexosaminidase